MVFTRAQEKAREVYGSFQKVETWQCKKGVEIPACGNFFLPRNGNWSRDYGKIGGFFS